MKNKDRFNCLQEAQFAYFKERDSWIKEHKTIITFEGWLFKEIDNMQDFCNQYNNGESCSKDFHLFGKDCEV